MRRFLIASFLLFFLLPASLPAAETPTGELKTGINRIFDLLNDKSLDPEGRNKQIEEIVRSKFDFNVMSQWILGIHWRKATPEQRQRFIDLYTDLLEANYQGRIAEYAEQYTDERVEYLGEQIKGDKALVDTLVVTKDQRIPISYKMIQQGNNWLIYDVVIEEVSLVRNYRSTYDEIVRKEGMEGLFSRMEQKIKELQATGGAAGPSAVGESL